MARPDAHNNSRVVIAAGFVLTVAGFAFWPLLLLGVPLLIIGGMLREGERHLRRQLEGREQARSERETEAEVARLLREQEREDR